MGDDTKKAEIAIVSTYDGRGAQQAAADQEKLTNTGKGLATQLPELDAATKAYVITTEQEYLAIQKSAEALRANIAVREAAGVAVTEQKERLAALDAALSTERALTIAGNIEDKLADAQKAEASFVATMAQAINVTKQLDAQGEATLVRILATSMHAAKVQRDLAAARLESAKAQQTAAGIEAAASEVYQIDSEAEYQAILKARNALASKLPVMAAGRKETEAAEAMLAAYNEALSTTAAQEIAASIASKANAAATAEATAAGEAQILTGRKMISLFDEISRGQRGAMISTLGSMLKGGGLADLMPIVGILASLIASFELWNHIVDATAESLGELKLPDLSDGIRQAEDEAQAWDGVTEAVAEADTEFNSVAESNERAARAIDAHREALTKLIEAQKDLDLSKLDIARATGQVSQGQYEAQRAGIERNTQDQATQAEINARQQKLGQQINSITNFRLESERYQREADAVTKRAGLGMTDKEEAAQKSDLQDIVKARQKEIDDARAQLARLSEATDDQTGEFRGDFDWVKLIYRYGGKVTTPGGYNEATRMEQNRVTENEAAQKEILQRIGALEEAEKQRDELRKRAATMAGKSEEARLATSGQTNPNTVGSVAWQNSQDTLAQHARDIASLNEQFAADVDALTKHTGDAKGTIANARAAIQDAADVMKQLQGFGMDVAGMQNQINELKNLVSRVQNAADNHF